MMKRFFVLSLILTLAVSAWGEDPVAINKTTLWVFDNLEVGDFTDTPHAINGLYASGHSSTTFATIKSSQQTISLSDSDKPTDSKELSVFTKFFPTSVSKSLYFKGGANNNIALTVNANTHVNDRAAFYASVPGTLYIYMSGTVKSGETRYFRIYSGSNGSNYARSDTEIASTDPVLLTHNISEASNVFWGTTSGSANIYAVLFIPAETVGTPSIVEDGGNITITAGTSTLGTGDNVDIKTYYTLNGTDPTKESTEYTGSFQVTEDCTVKAICINEKTGRESDVETKAVSFTPVPTSYNISLAEGVSGVAFDKASAAAGETVTITVTPQTGYQLVAGSLKVNDGAVEVNPSGDNYTFVMPEGDVTVSAAFELVNYPITYSGLDGASMTGMNPESYTIETETFTLINPTKEGSVFAGWTGTGLTEATTTVTITKGSTGARSYTATWTEPAAPTTHTLTVNVDDASHGSVAITVGGVAANSGDAVAEGASVTLTATANSGFTFKNWGSDDLTTNPYTFEMGTADVSLTATFEEIPSGAEEYVSAATTWTFNDYTDGKITSNQCNAKLYARAYSGSAADRTFTISSVASEIQSQSIGGKSITVTKKATGGENINVPNTLSLKTANENTNGMKPFFAFNTTLGGTCYVLIQKVNDQNSNSYRNRIYWGDGTNAIVSKYANDPGNTDINEISFKSESAGTFVVGSSAGNSAIYAIRFAPTRTVSIGSMSNGSVLADKSTAEEGETISLTVNPASGYELETLSVNGTAIEGTSFTMPDADVTVTATFKELPASNYSISLAEGVTGVSFDKASAAAGDKVTITVTVPEGYQLTGGKPTVMSGETSVEVSAVEGQANKFEFTMPAGDVTVTVSFEAITYTITYSGLDGASMTGMNPESYTIETETFTLINPTKEGSVFAGWTGTGLTEATTTVTITKGSTEARSYTATWTDEQQEETEEYVSAATTWTFNSQETGEITSRKVIDKLYARVVSGRSYTFEALGTAQPLTFSDGASTQVSVEKVATGTGNISYNAKIKTANDSPSGSSNDMTPSFAFNTTVKGTVYVFLQEVGETHNSSYRQRIYFGDGSSAVTSQYSKEGAKALGVEEIKWTSSTAGTFVVGSTTSLSKIYAIRFVPTRSITISDAIEHGTVIADKSEGGMGDVVTLTVTPSTGYELESISVNGIAIEGTSFSMPDADVTVMATFKAVDYIVTVTQPTGGEVKVSVAGGEATSSNTTAQYGQTITLSNTPSGGYTFSSYSVTKTSGGEAVTVTDGSFTMPAEAVTVTAIFAEKSKTDISGAVVTLSATSFTYDGSTHAPEVTKVTLNGTDLTLGTDYTVNTIESQTNVGAYTVTVTGTGNYTGTATAGWTIKRNLGVTLDGTQQWATYFSAEDLAKPEGVTVYRVTGVADHVVYTEQVSYIKAGVGVLLYSETAVDAEKWIVGPDSGEDYTSTLLGSVEAGTMAAGTNYVLYNNQFMLAEDNILPANHCYLQMSGVNGARSLTIGHGDDNTTSIHTIPKDHGDMINDEYYTLSGQRVEKPTKKGLYIVNGRKVVIK